MIKFLLISLFLTDLAQGQGLLKSALDDTVVNITDAMRRTAAVEYANARLAERIALFNYIRDKAASGTEPGISLHLGAHHTLNFLHPSKSADVDQAEYYNDFVYKYTEGMSDNDINAILNHNSLEIDVVMPGQSSAPTYPDCDAVCNAGDTYRTFDGMCNNLEYCLEGSRGNAMGRLVPASYGEFGSPRPDDSNPFHIAKNSFNVTRKEAERITSTRSLSQMHMTWGQFLAHDILATASRTIPTSDGKPINVDCTLLPDDVKWDECLFFGWNTRRRVNFVRSASGLVTKGKEYRFGHRAQINMQTAFIDASQVYGTTSEAAALLYDSNTGLLKSENLTRVPDEEFMITSPDVYCEGEEGNDCFVTGDTRVNIQLGMMMIHNLFLREHNHIANKIRASSSLSGEEVYQKTRQIIGAYMQSITYNDYLPLVLGNEMMDRYGLTPKLGSSYDANIMPTIYNCFGTAAFRFGHSQIYNMIRMANTRGNLTARAGLFSSMFDPDRFYKDSNGFTVMRRYTMGLALDKCDAVDTTFGSTISFKLFRSKTPNRPSHVKRGTSLPAINLQRGRDHGLPTCGAFMDLIQEKTGDTPENIDDPVKRSMDLFHCGLGESQQDDSEVGLTFGHIIGTQMRNLMIGDRFFYSHTNNQIFSSAQREEIEKVKLSQLICRHINTVVPNRRLKDIKLTDNVFQVASQDNNPILDCDDDIIPASPDVLSLI